MQRLGGWGRGTLSSSKEQTAGEPAWWEHSGVPTGGQGTGEHRDLASCHTARVGESPPEGVHLSS